VIIILLLFDLTFVNISFFLDVTKSAVYRVSNVNVVTSIIFDYSNCSIGIVAFGDNP